MRSTQAYIITSVFVHMCAFVWKHMYIFVCVCVCVCVCVVCVCCVYVVCVKEQEKV